MKLKYTGLLIVLVGLIASGCKKQQTVFENPYPPGKAALGIVSDPQQVPVPSQGPVGTEVTIKATGLLPYKDKLIFLFNGQKGDITEVTATGVKVKVPARASSGITSFVVDGQLVFGPSFNVLGKVNIDFTYVNYSGTDGTVYKAFPIPNTTDLIVVGAFTNYNGNGYVKRINRIAKVAADGTWDRTFQVGTGANNTINSITKAGPYYYVAGDFNGFAQQSGLGKITRLSPTGSIDTVPVITYTAKIKFVPAFNGGVTSTVREIYPVGTNQVIITGDFNYYVSFRYNESNYKYLDSVITDSIDVRQLARLNENGSIDKTWRFNATAPGYKNQPGRSFPGGNGRLYSLIHPDGKLLCYGQFSKFDDVAAGYIVRLNADGTIDPTFNVGTGADDYIHSVSYNAALNKYIAVGRFKTFNGKATKNIVALNYDGSVDQNYVPKVFEGGEPYYVKLLDDGLTVISGDFKNYDGVVRNGFMITDQTGNLKEGFNTTGTVVGPAQKILDIYETRSADNKRALLIMGNFSIFDNRYRNNMIRVTIE